MFASYPTIANRMLLYNILAVIFVFACMGQTVYQWRLKLQGGPPIKDWRPIIVSILATAPISLITFNMPFLLVVWFNHNRYLIIEAVSDPFYTWVWFAIGVLLYYFRCLLRTIYGVGEIIVGSAAILSSISVAGEVHTLMPQLVAVLGGVYILVRGLDNMDQGLPPSMKPLWDGLFLKNFGWPRPLPKPSSPPNS